MAFEICITHRHCYLHAAVVQLGRLREESDDE
jgi:hypothetical protein